MAVVDLSLETEKIANNETLLLQVGGKALESPSRNTGCQ